MKSKDIIIKVLSDSILFGRIAMQVEALFNLSKAINHEFKASREYNGYVIALDLLCVNSEDLKEELIEIYLDIAYDLTSDEINPKDLALNIYETWLEMIKDFYLKVA